MVKVAQRVPSCARRVTRDLDLRLQALATSPREWSRRTLRPGQAYEEAPQSLRCIPVDPIRLTGLTVGVCNPGPAPGEPAPASPEASDTPGGPAVRESSAVGLLCALPSLTSRFHREARLAW
jgi:hypothetical protein